MQPYSVHVVPRTASTCGQPSRPHGLPLFIDCSRLSPADRPPGFSAPDSELEQWRPQQRPLSRNTCWLQQEHEAGRPYDVCVFLETAWKADAEFTATLDDQTSLKWHAIHSAGPDHAGILCLVRAGLVPPEHLRYNILVPHRLLHVRLLFATPLDLLCTYQWSWNPGKVEFQGKHRIEEMKRQRKHIWQRIEKWVGSLPQRSSSLLIGDFNAAVTPEQFICGSGVMQGNGSQHPDQGTFQEILRNFGYCALNTWSGSNARARTYLPPNATAQHGTQIDYVIMKAALADSTAKLARPFWADFVATTGCRHLPIQASVPAPHGPKPSTTPPRLQPRHVQALLRQPNFVHTLQHAVRQRLQEAGQAPGSVDGDALLLESWQQVLDGQVSQGSQPLTGQWPGQHSLTRCYTGGGRDPLPGIFSKRGSSQPSCRLSPAISARPVDTRR